MSPRGAKIKNTPTSTFTVYVFNFLCVMLPTGREAYMRGNNFSLSYRAGFNIAKGVHFYLSPRPAWLYRFAERNNIGNRWMKVCKICFAILVIFFITDIHRYGAWYSGGATYIKPWWQFACVLLWIPIAFAVIKCFAYYLESFKTILVMIPLMPLMMFVIFFIMVSITYIAEDTFCILHGYVYLPDEEFDDVLTIAAICGIITGLASAFAVFRDNGFRLELDDMNDNEGEAGGL
jgi:hypothetical protein